MIAVPVSGQYPHRALTRWPASGPFTTVTLSRPRRAGVRISTKPSPPSHTGWSNNVAAGTTSRSPSAIASAASRAVNDPLNESGAMRIVRNASRDGLIRKETTTEREDCQALTFSTIYLIISRTNHVSKNPKHIIMKNQPVILAQAHYREIKNATYELAVLPWGATEAHNLHLPYGTDIIESERIAAESARLAAARGAKVVVLPPVPFGVNTGQLDIPLTINMNPSTQMAVLADVATSLQHQGIRKLAILNGHGGERFPSDDS